MKDPAIGLEESFALSGLMMSRAARDEWLVRMAPEMFPNPAPSEMFRAIRAVHQKGITPTPEACFEQLASTMGSKKRVASAKWYVGAFNTLTTRFFKDDEVDIAERLPKYIEYLGNRWADRIAGMGESELAALKVCGYGPDQVKAREEQLAKNEERAREVTTPTAEAIESLDDGDTDLAAANRFARANGHNVRFCPEKSAWYVWDNRRWRLDQGNSIVTRMAAQCARKYSISCIAKDLKILQAARKLENDNRIRGAVRQASALAQLRVELNQLDAVPHLLNFQNGTVDLRTAELGQHCRDHLLTHLVEMDYNPKAGAPRFLKFLEEIHPGQPEVTEFVKRWIGYCLTGEIREHKFIVAVGEGRNGKGTLFETIAGFLGPQLAFQAPRSLLMHRKFDGHPAEFQALRGKRMVLVSEVDGGQSFGPERVKWLTGGDSITARGMREDFSTFMPTHKFCMYVNDLPSVSDSSPAFWERVRVISFNEQFLGARKDQLLKDKLLSEAQGIMAWCVQGAASWYADGLTNPREVDLASLSYRNDTDDVKRWLEDILLDPSMAREQTAKFFFDSYVSWCERNGGREMSMKALASEMKRHKATKRRTKRGAEWTLPSLEDLIGTVTGDACDGFLDSSLIRGDIMGVNPTNPSHPSPVTTAADEEDDVLPF